MTCDKCKFGWDMECAYCGTLTEKGKRFYKTHKKVIKMLKKETK